MSVTLGLSPEQEQRLRREARTRGVDAADLLQQLLLDALARLEGATPATSAFAASTPGTPASATTSTRLSRTAFGRVRRSPVGEPCPQPSPVSSPPWFD